jgi:hypothetical protein
MVVYPQAENSEGPHYLILWQRPAPGTCPQLAHTSNGQNRNKGLPLLSWYPNEGHFATYFSGLRSIKSQISQFLLWQIFCQRLLYLCSFK